MSLPRRHAPGIRAAHDPWARRRRGCDLRGHGGCRRKETRGGKGEAGSGKKGKAEGTKNASGLEGGRDLCLAYVAICIKRLRLVSCRSTRNTPTPRGTPCRRYSGHLGSSAVRCLNLLDLVPQRKFRPNCSSLTFPMQVLFACPVITRRNVSQKCRTHVAVRARACRDGAWRHEQLLFPRRR